MHILKKPIITVFLTAVIIIFSAGIAVAQYNISGLVSFSYLNYETKVGNQKTTNTTFSQNYQTQLSDYIWDRRLVTYNAGVGYNVYNYSNRGDSTGVDYNLNASFFPGMKIAWDLFGMEKSERVQSSTNLAGYELNTTSYGGTLYLRLNGPGLGRNSNNNSNNNGNNNRNRNNRNNYNNNFNSGWKRFPLPDITLSRTHHQSQSIITLINETRDDTVASLFYRYNSRFQFELDGKQEEYSNIIDASSYDSKTLNIGSRIRLNSDAVLTLDGSKVDRSTSNIAGYNTDNTMSKYSALLNFREMNGIKNSYRYAFSQQKFSGFEATTQSIEAEVTYGFKEHWNMRGGANYGIADYRRNNLSSEEKGKVETGSLLVGASYNEIYRPQFLGPFGFVTSYDLNAGFSKLSGKAEGSGWYYSNSLGAGFRSIGWTQESLKLDYFYTSKRDFSPLNNDTNEHRIAFSVSTYRLARTQINASANYAVQNKRSESFDVFTELQPGIETEQRTVSYNMSAVHQASSGLTLAAGATKGDSSSSTKYSLSTLTSTVNVQDELFYGSANFLLWRGRMLGLRGELREEYRSTIADVKTLHHQATLHADYRLRAIVINLEYKWQQIVPNNSLRTTQQYYYAKLSRQF